MKASIGRIAVQQIRHLYTWETKYLTRQFLFLFELLMLTVLTRSVTEHRGIAEHFP